MAVWRPMFPGGRHQPMRLNLEEGVCSQSCNGFCCWVEHQQILLQCKILWELERERRI